MDSTPIKVISLMCPLYSGSTLLTLLLATHPSIGTLGEGQKFFLRVIEPEPTLPEIARTCSCGQPFTSCAFWQSIRAVVKPQIPPRIWALNFTGYHLYRRWSLNKVARRTGYEFARHGWPLPPPLSRRFADVCKANSTFIQAVLKKRRASTYLDATKNLANTVLMNAWPGFDVRIVQLTRDARGQIASSLKHRPDLPIEEACRNWVAEISTARRVLGRSNFKTLELRYEELCARPDQVMPIVYRFADLDPAQGSLEFRRFDQHIMGNVGTRFGGDSTIRDREEWRAKLTTSQLAVIEQIAGGLNHSLGYI